MLEDTKKRQYDAISEISVRVLREHNPIVRLNKANSESVTSTHRSFPTSYCCGRELAEHRDGGSFDAASAALLASGYTIDWHDAPRREVDQEPGGEKIPAAPKKDRVKFTCGSCGLNAWMRPSGEIKCGFCNQHMRAAGTIEARAS